MAAFPAAGKLACPMPAMPPVLQLNQNAWSKVVIETSSRAGLDRYYSVATENWSVKSNLHDVIGVH